jgi:N-acetylglucosamine-6-sulfatase
MRRRDFLGTLPAAGAAPLFGAGKKRNLVLILSDDHRWDMMGCRGHPWIQTPQMDRLAAGGMLFENAFVTTSLCSPSRASILTGQYSHAHGVHDNSTPLPSGVPTFPRVLQQHGYRTAFIGKWHMGGTNDAPRPGFDRWFSFRGQGSYVDPDINDDGERQQRKGYLTDILTEEAVRFIGENQARPFLLYLSHKAVHGHFIPADRHKEMYASAKIPHPPSMADTEENYRGKPAWLRQQRDSWHGVDGMYNHQVSFDDVYRGCARTLMSLDDSIGAVQDELEAQGLANDTLVIYMGDNGFQFGDHGLIDKRVMYEPSIRIPMIARCPDLFEGGRTVDGMALNLDICPTLLDAAGAASPSTVHGRSLLPLIRGAEGWRKDFLYEYFWERAYPQTPTVVGLRTDRYSFMRYHGVWDLYELYDIQADPEQMNNLLAGVRTTTEGGRLFNRIQDPELRALVAGFEDVIRERLARTSGRMEPTWGA